MRQTPFPPAHAGWNLCGKSLPRFRTATPRTHRKYAQSVRANRTLTLLGDTYVDWCPGVSPHRYPAPNGVYGQPRGKSCRFQGIDAKGFRAAPGRKVGRAFPVAEP